MRIEKEIGEGEIVRTEGFEETMREEKPREAVAQERNNVGKREEKCVVRTDA